MSQPMIHGACTGPGRCQRHSITRLGQVTVRQKPDSSISASDSIGHLATGDGVTLTGCIMIFASITIALPISVLDRHVPLGAKTDLNGELSGRAAYITHRSACKTPGSTQQAR